MVSLFYALLLPFEYGQSVLVLWVLLCVQGAGGLVTDWTGKQLYWNPTPGSDLKDSYPEEVLAAGGSLLCALCMLCMAWAVSAPCKLGNKSHLHILNKLCCLKKLESLMRSRCLLFYR